MAYQKCYWNQRLRCPKPLDCPLQDKRWVEALEVWALVGRDPAAINWERGGEPNPKAEERKTLRKAEIARLFEIPEVVEAMLKFGGMTRMICEDINRGRFLWNETRDGITLKRAKERWIERIRRGKY